MGRTVIEVRALVKRYGTTTAVDGLSFDVRPGRVTGFLGPNGAGKSTTMRMILGLDRPHAGTVTVNGHPYAASRLPLTEVGALLDSRAVHPGRSARNHLLWLARSNGIGRRRVGELLDLVGLTSVGGRRAGGFSLGMAQRLGVAAALLGDPGVLLFDEPVNGLDLEGIRWIRSLLRGLAAEGRTVFVSSHLMSEMALTADHLVVIGRGRLVADVSQAELLGGDAGMSVRARCSEPDRLVAVLDRAGGRPRRDPDGCVEVTGLGAEAVGEAAAAAGLVLHELTPVRASLEAAYLELVDRVTDHRTAGPREDRLR